MYHMLNLALDYVFWLWATAAGINRAQGCGPPHFKKFGHACAFHVYILGAFYLVLLSSHNCSLISSWLGTQIKSCPHELPDSFMLIVKS